MKLGRIIKGLAILAALLLILGFYPTEAKDLDYGNGRYEEKFQKTLNLPKDGHVYLSNVSGDIEVKSWSENKVKIQALKVGRVKENLKRVKIEITKTGNTVRIKTRYPSRWDKLFSRSINVSVDYWLLVPEEASIEIGSVSGDIEIEKIGGSVDAESVSGSIDVIKANKGVDCQSVSGELTLEDINGDANLETVSGEITLDRIKGSVEAETVSGEIELMDVSKAQEVEAESVSGDIDYKGDINPDGKYVLESHSGGIHMILPADAAFELEAKTFSGEIECDFDISVSGKIKVRNIHGVVNKGGAVVRLSTFSGSITIEKR